MPGSYFSAVFALLACGIMIFVNVGVTQNNSFLPKLYFCKLSSPASTTSVIYGAYSSCLVDVSSNLNCTSNSLPKYLDLDQLVTFAGVNKQQLESHVDLQKVKNVNGASVSVLPVVVLSFLAFLVASFAHKRSRSLTCIGSFLCLIAFAVGTCGMVLTVYTFIVLITGLRTILSVDYQWGPAMYMYAASDLLLLFAFIGFIVDCCRHPKYRPLYMANVGPRTVKDEYQLPVFQEQHQQSDHAPFPPILQVHGK